jgi:single-strand DNA-binding protein
MAWNETKLTLTGRLCTDVSTRQTQDGTVMATFMVAANERKFDKELGTWVAGNSLFIPVKCYRRLAENVAASLGKGDPVVVTGRIHTHKYDKDGRTHSEVQMDAHGVGPDLSFCQAVMQRGLPMEAVAA